MQGTSENLVLLSGHNYRLLRFATLDEHNFRDDEPAALGKIRSLVEIMAEDSAAAHAVRGDGGERASFDEVFVSEHEDELISVADIFGGKPLKPIRSRARGLRAC